MEKKRKTGNQRAKIRERMRESGLTYQQALRELRLEEIKEEEN